MGSKADEIIQQLQQSMAVEHITSLMGGILPICFDLCILKPGTKLSNQESDCLTRCSENFNESMAITSNIFMKKINKMRQL
jgi:hypothetical protein